MGNSGQIIITPGSLATIAQATQQTLDQVAQAVKDAANLLVSDRLLHIPYSIQSSDSLRLLEQKAQAISPRLNLTLVNIAEQKSTVVLRSNISLVLPERVTIASGLPSTTAIPVNATLSAIATTLNSNRQTAGQISLADVAIANQSMIGLLQVNQWVIKPDATPETLNTHSSPNLNVEDWRQIINANIKTRDNETLYTLAI